MNLYHTKSNDIDTRKALLKKSNLPTMTLQHEDGRKLNMYLVGGKLTKDYYYRLWAAQKLACEVYSFYPWFTMYLKKIETYEDGLYGGTEWGFSVTKTKVTNG